MLDREAALFAARTAAFANARHGDIAQATLGSALWGGVRWGLGGLAVGAIGVFAAPAATAIVGTELLVGGLGSLGALYGLYRGSQELSPEQRQRRDLLESYATFANLLKSIGIHEDDERSAKKRESILEQVESRITKLAKNDELNLVEIKGYVEIARTSVSNLKDAIKRFQPPEKKYALEKSEAPPEQWDAIDETLDDLIAASSARYTSKTPRKIKISTFSATPSVSSSSKKTLSSSQIDQEADYLINRIEEMKFTGNKSVYPSQSGISTTDKVKIARSLRDRYHTSAKAEWAGDHVYYYIVWEENGKIDITGHRIINGNDKSWGKSNVFNYHVEW
jgi:hypothetical protein